MDEITDNEFYGYNLTTEISELMKDSYYGSIFINHCYTNVEMKKYLSISDFNIDYYRFFSPTKNSIKFKYSKIKLIIKYYGYDALMHEISKTTLYNNYIYVLYNLIINNKNTDEVLNVLLANKVNKYTIISVLFEINKTQQRYDTKFKDKIEIFIKSNEVFKNLGNTDYIKLYLRLNNGNGITEYENNYNIYLTATQFGKIFFNIKYRNLDYDPIDIKTFVDKLNHLSIDIRYKHITSILNDLYEYGEYTHMLFFFETLYNNGFITTDIAMSFFKFMSLYKSFIYNKTTIIELLKSGLDDKLALSFFINRNDRYFRNNKNSMVSTINTEDYTNFINIIKFYKRRKVLAKLKMN